MYRYRKVTDDVYWIGSNDRRLSMFEGVYSVPDGVSYNSYLITDEKTVLMDTVDAAVSKVFFENIAHILGERPLDYVVVSHMEPDHSATLGDLLIRYPDVKIVCSALAKKLIDQFFPEDYSANIQVVAEGDVLDTGSRQLQFVSAPMVHWPEVMVAYDSKDGILFSADAFGSFGALNGALFCDEVDFERDYLDEARRYYTNIVGKYGPQVTAVLDKAQGLDIKMLCPLHGFVWRENIEYIVGKYRLWATYTPEVQGVMIAYASIYGNTENAAEILSSELRERGVRTVMYDVSVTPASDIISACFKYSHLVFASPTYNSGVFVRMEELLRDLEAHNISNRKVALIENGSWAPTAAKHMKKILEGCKGIEFLDNNVTIRSSVKAYHRAELEALADAVRESIPMESRAEEPKTSPFHNLSYGLFVLSAKDAQKDNGCIINTMAQISDGDKKIVSIAVNKTGLTHDMILSTGKFNVSVLTKDTPLEVYRRFGYQSGRDAEKFPSDAEYRRGENGIIYIDDESVNTYFGAQVIQTIDCDTHTLFVAQVTESKVLSAGESVTYEEYLQNVKPAKPVEKKKVKGYVCKICGYVYEGEELPEDFVCPWCKHGADDFEPIE